MGSFAKSDFMFFFMPNLFSVIWLIVFTGIMVMFIITVVQRMKQWKKNNDSPRLTVPAKVVTKRGNTYRRHGGNTHRTHTDYYVTFEVASGDRMELKVQDYEYGMLVEGDMGNLSFQGTRYLGFERKIM